MEHEKQEARIKELETELADCKKKYNAYVKYMHSTKEDIGATITLTVLLFAIGIGLAVALHQGWTLY